MVELKNVFFDYGKQKTVFRDLSLQLENGHVYGLLGSNGAGKSTLLKLISGLVFAKTGTCKVDEHTCQNREVAFLQELFLLPEEIHTPNLSIKDYINVYAPFYPNFSKIQFKGYLDEFQLADNEMFKDMSLGQKKKALIGFALATNTKVLLLDEPTNGLDIPSKSQFRKIIASVATVDRIIIISTHQVRDLVTLIDKVIILNDSQVLLNATIEKISEKLCFKNVPSINVNDNILYSEQSLKGFSVVSKNTDIENSKVDLEQLFNASLAKSEEIKQIFSN
jgi:ABC-2 type transport system ATP-binding protein